VGVVMFDTAQTMLGSGRSICCMNVFFVLDTSAATRRIALVDKFGKYHVAQCQDALPDLFDSLEGCYAIPGPGLLVDPKSGQLHPVTFESVNCGWGDPRRRHKARKKD
jgi:hypothetical protein